MTQRGFVTGAMGFLGAHLVERLIRDGWDLTVYDRKPKPKTWHASPHYIVGDVLNAAQLAAAMDQTKPDVVFHLAALADVRSALKMPVEQRQQNFLATSFVLEAMRAAGVKRIAFTSSAVVYGDIQPTAPPSAVSFAFNSTGMSTSTITYSYPPAVSELQFPKQTSIYGAMKLASEALIEAYCEGYGMQSDILRLVSVVGAGYRHGNLMDFYRKLKADRTRLELFGSPTQQKYYIDVHDVIDALMLTVNRDHAGAEIWNVSHDQPNTIQDSIDAACKVTGAMPEIVSAGESWAGDLPQLVLDCSKLRALGWAPRVPITEGMRATVQDFLDRGIA